MNLFILALKAAEAAKDHCDKHCIKMILEITQQLYTAHWFNTGQPDWNFNVCEYPAYRMAHKNHMGSS